MNLHARLSAMAAFAALTFAAAPLYAQSQGETEVRDTSAVRQPAPSAMRGPTVASARIASHSVSTPNGAPPVIQNRTSNKNAVALMIVGGAALVIGAVIGDDAGTLVMLGGAAIGLYGLYHFLT
jgi:hypothetical protein